MFRFSFIRTLVFFSVLAVLLLPVYTILLVSPSFIEFITESREKQAARVALHMESKLIPDQKHLERAMLTPDVLEKIKGTCQDFNLNKVRIIFPTGEILYSNFEGEIGTRIKVRQFYDTVSHGRIFTKLTERGQMNLEGETVANDIIETYVPIMRDRKFIGAFEIYYDITATKEKVGGLLWRLYATVFPITLFLLVAVIVSYLRTNRNIVRRQQAEDRLIRQSEQLKEVNEDLSELFEICKYRQKKLEEEQKARQKAQEQVQEEMMKRERQKAELLRHIVAAQEEERSRIARELHDETAQTLTAASLNFATLQNLLEDKPQLAGLVGRLQDLCRQMNRDLYRLVHDLRPAQLDDLGLVPALRYLTDEGQRDARLEVDFGVIGRIHRLDPYVETVIFRIVQEALTNVTRHAGTDRASVQLVFGERNLTLTVHDEGRGFDTAEQRQNQRGWGLVGMTERIESINGSLRIESQPGEGTLIVVRVPDCPPLCSIQPVEDLLLRRERPRLGSL